MKVFFFSTLVCLLLSSCVSVESLRLHAVNNRKLPQSVFMGNFEPSDETSSYGFIETLIRHELGGRHLLIYSLSFSTIQKNEDATYEQYVLPVYAVVQELDARGGVDRIPFLDINIQSVVGVPDILRISSTGKVLEAYILDERGVKRSTPQRNFFKVDWKEGNPQSLEVPGIVYALISSGAFDAQIQSPKPLPENAAAILSQVEQLFSLYHAARAAGVYTFKDFELLPKECVLSRTVSLGPLPADIALPAKAVIPPVQKSPSMMETDLPLLEAWWKEYLQAQK
jgi:hypothetical protein